MTASVLGLGAGAGVGTLPGAKTNDWNGTTRRLTMDELERQRALEEERDRLAELCDVLERDRTNLERGATAELSHLDQHQADDGSDLFEAELEMSLLARARADLAAVTDALGRLSNGTYGHCEACLQPIPDERLAAVPATRFCIEHEALSEGSAAFAVPGTWRYADRGLDVDDPAGREAAQHLEFLPLDDEVDEPADHSSEEEAVHPSDVGDIWPAEGGGRTADLGVATPERPQGAM
jgi:RNA polymerase-binding transcription factor DksA